MKTREEIYRALELCSSYDYRCNECPYHDEITQEGCHAYELMNDAAEMLKQQFWISCSKQMPQPFIRVLAQVQRKNGDLWDPLILRYFENKDDWELDDGGWVKEEFECTVKVIAWMPLPEVYKE